MKEKFGKHQKVSKYYDQDYLKNFLLPFMSSLRAPFFENSHFVAYIYFIFLKTHPRSNFKCILDQTSNTSTHDRFLLLLKKNLVKHQEVSKYYDQDCSYGWKLLKQ